MGDTIRRSGKGGPPAAPAPPHSLLAPIYGRMLKGAGVEVNGSRAWDMQVTDPRVWRRLAMRGSLGLGEAYVDGWWDAARLDEFFSRVIYAKVAQRIANLPKRIVDGIAALGNLQRIHRSAEVGQVHYDLSNELYQAMLGERMVYTCGYWRDATTLDGAQENKLELVCRKLEIEPGMRVLDVGCGWGSFAKYAAERHDVSVIGITISDEQATLARAMCRGLPVEIRVQDYREVRGKFDRIVSLGMIEHVGRKNYGLYMDIVRRLLADEGRFVLQTIGRNDSGSGIDPWVTRYIFPNSEIPTLQRITAAIDGRLKMEDWHNFGLDYDRTLMAWHNNFSAAWPRFAGEFGDRFYRLWSYYLLMFAGVFRARELDLWQIVMSPHGVKGDYRRPLY